MSENISADKLMMVRKEKAADMRAAGMNPYANDFTPELDFSAFVERYGQSTKEMLNDVHDVHSIAGRVMAKRVMGKAAFVRLRDSHEELQLFIQKNAVGEDLFDRLRWVDLGDFVGAVGTPMKTKTGELSLKVQSYRIVTKALRPPPEKFHGLSDVETRYRKRYVDLAMSMDVRKIFRARSMIISGIRAFLDKQGYLEVETPILGDVAGGASAKPFLTHHNSLNMDLQMRIATELHLKRLVVGGLERVYEIGRLFRNEGISTRHNPEFTTIEFYQAYATYQDLMNLTEDMIGGLVERLHGSDTIRYGEHEISFKRPWRRASIATLVSEHFGVSPMDDIDSVETALVFCADKCGTKETPLLTCLKELSDEEAYQLIPGIQRSADDGSTVVFDAKQAFRAGGDDFYKHLGEAMDAYWQSESGTVIGLDFEEKTGALPAERPVHDTMREKRRRCALSLLYAVFDAHVEATLIQPTFITDFSVTVSPLARKRDGDPAVVDRFELMVAGMEIANAFSELNDPVDQKERFLAQVRERVRGDDEAPDIDHDYIEALECGMPPTAGEGIGIDRLVMLLTNQQSIREVILFPQMRRLASADDA